MLQVTSPGHNAGPQRRLLPTSSLESADHRCGAVRKVHPRSRARTLASAGRTPRRRFPPPDSPPQTKYVYLSNTRLISASNASLLPDRPSRHSAFSISPRYYSAIRLQMLLRLMYIKLGFPSDYFPTARSEAVLEDTFAVGSIASHHEKELGAIPPRNTIGKFSPTGVVY